MTHPAYAATQAEQLAMTAIVDHWQGEYSPLVERMAEVDLPALVDRTAAKLNAGETLDALDRWVLDSAVRFLKPRPVSPAMAEIQRRERRAFNARALQAAARQRAG